MAAPVLANKKFWIVKPKAGSNRILNPRFDTPEGFTGWSESGAGVTKTLTGDHQRRGAYSLQVNTATNVVSAVFYSSLDVFSGYDYTFSCDVKGVAGQIMKLYIQDVAYAVKATKTFTATGYWQREEVTLTAEETATTYRVAVSRNAVASAAAFYVDGAQFELASKATTFIHGYAGNGYSWSGLARQSLSIRSAFIRSGGELVDLATHCKVITDVGLGNGDWNQIVTKMTSGGDMYQTAIRKSRQFSIVVSFIGDTLGELETSRKALIDLIRPDLLEGEEMVVRYQGFAANGDEATNPVDIRCVPLPMLQDVPDLSVHQRAVLNFSIPSGLLEGAYEEGAALDFYADFAAEFIVKRDPNGNWCNWVTDHYENPLAGINGTVYNIKEAPNGDIYVCGLFTNAGGVAAADYIARWSKVNQAWEAVGDPVTGATITNIYTMAFDAAGDLYVGGAFTNLAGIANADYFAKYTLGTGAPAAWAAVGSGIDGSVNTIAISPAGTVYIAGGFATASGNTNCNAIAYLVGSTWTPLATGLNSQVFTLAFASDGRLIIGGMFTNATGTVGDYICWWDGTAFHSFTELGATELNAYVYSAAFTQSGALIVGGTFTNAGGDVNADYLATWGGNNWVALGAGSPNFNVWDISCLDNGDIYLGGHFTAAGGLALCDKVVKVVQGAYQPLDIGLPGLEIVYSIFKASDGSLYIGGAFSTIAETPDVNAETGVVALNLDVSSASANVYPFMQIHGPGTLKSIANYSTGKSVQFDGLTLQAGEWINLYFDPTNLKFVGGWSGRGNLMRYVVAGSDYGEFFLKPGTNYLSLFMTDTTAASGAFMIWKPMFWGLDGALL